MRRLASCLGATPRTVRYDLASLRQWLKDWNMSLVSDRAKGIRLQGPPEDWSALQQVLRDETDRVVQQPEERQRIIIWALVAEDPDVGLDRLCDRLAVSRRTLYYDLSQIEARCLVPAGVRLARPKRRRLAIVGNELQCREAVYHLMRQSLEPTPWLTVLLGLLPPNSADALLSTPPLRPLWHMLRVENPTDYQMELLVAILCRHPLEHISDVVLAEFALHVLIGVRRCLAGHHISGERITPWIQGCPEAATAASLVARLGPLIPEPLPAGETGYIALRLLASEPTDSPRRRRAPKNDRPTTMAAQLAREIVADPEALKHGLRRRGSDLTAELTAQLRPVITRLQFGFSTAVPSYSQVESRYPETFAAVARVARRMMTDGYPQLPPNELQRITALLASVVEEGTTGPCLPQKALVICPCGTAWAKMITARLKKEFPFLRLEAATASDALRRRGVNWDLVISNVDIDLPDRPVVVVSPVLAPDDVMSIHQALSGVTSAGRKRPEQTGDDAPATDTVARAAQLPTLCTLIDEPMIQLGTHVTSPDEAIRVVGSLLQNRGLVTPGYVEAMSRMYRQYGPYLVIAPGVAMPHARPEDGALASGFSFCRLSRPIPFGPDPCHLIDLVFGFATTGDTSPVRAITDLIELLQHPDRLMLLRHVQSPRDVLEILCPPRAGK